MKNLQNPKNPTGTENPNETVSSFTLRSLNIPESEVTKLKEALKISQSEKKLKVERVFGNVADKDVWRVDSALAEKAQCEGCDGECRKESGKYYVPCVQVKEGNVTITRQMCRYEVARRYRLSQLPMRYSDCGFSDYEKTADNRDAVELAQVYEKKKPTASLYFYGATGTGKTFLTALIAKGFLKDGYSVEFGDIPSLLGRIKRTFGTAENGGEVIDRYKNCDLLILDDLGVGRITEWNVDILYQVINERYNANRRLIVTSNYDLKGLAQRLKTEDGDVFIAKRIVSRLSEMCTQAFFGTNDRRF